MTLDIEIDVSHLTPMVPSAIKLAREGSPEILAAFDFDGRELQMPLSIFFCVPVRREIERHLEARDSRPQWELARRTVDHAGAPVRVVPVLRVEDVAS